jgi:4'-phosphopantetheinyl transferase
LQLPPEHNHFPRPALDLWFESLAVGEADCNNYWSLLDRSERVRAKSFIRELDRRRYSVSHGKLRRILSAYLQLPPEKIAFATRTYGKPYIVGEEVHAIRFNLAHAGDYLAVAVSQGFDVGVDIEVWTETVDYEAVVALCFADSESRFWLNLPAEEKRKFFYRLWTRKESFIKAVGTGLGLDVAQVITEPGGPGRFLSLPAGYGGPECWSLLDLELDGCISGALTFPARYSPVIAYQRL